MAKGIYAFDTAFMVADVTMTWRTYIIISLFTLTLTDEFWIYRVMRKVTTRANVSRRIQQDRAFSCSSPPPFFFVFDNSHFPMTTL